MICVVCDVKNNDEEGIECKQCKFWTCFECVTMEEGIYYCNLCKCQDIEE